MVVTKAVSTKGTTLKKTFTCFHCLCYFVCQKEGLKTFFLILCLIFFLQQSYLCFFLNSPLFDGDVLFLDGLLSYNLKCCRRVNLIGQFFESSFILNQPPSSLHFSLSFCPFLYSGLCYKQIMMSINDVIFVQKSSNGVEKFTFYGWDYLSA